MSYITTNVFAQEPFQQYITSLIWWRNEPAIANQSPNSRSLEPTGQATFQLASRELKALTRAQKWLAKKSYPPYIHIYRDVFREPLCVYILSTWFFRNTLAHLSKMRLDWYTAHILHLMEVPRAVWITEMQNQQTHNGVYCLSVIIQTLPLLCFWRNNLWSKTPGTSVCSVATYWNTFTN